MCDIMKNENSAIFHKFGVLEKRKSIVNNESYLTPEEYGKYIKWYYSKGPGIIGIENNIYSIKHIKFPNNRIVSEEHGIIFTK